MIFKTDFVRAYDLVSWIILNDIMKQMKFLTICLAWMEWGVPSISKGINASYGSPTWEFQLNGAFVPYIYMEVLILLR